ncbi:hypothetical protein [Oscillibacter sp.]|uniref:hypothetical protein n=1 Tax=Oscillibacter sp. TaxID=1945593 RepID=UPI002D7F999F|nr:hypothetical protein [Oscillibacter sp.]
MKRKNSLLLQGVKQLNLGAMVSGAGFLLYLGAAALGLTGAADVLSLAFALVSLYVFVSAAEGRRQDKEAVSYNLLWGTGALAMLTCLCAAATLRQRLGA